MKNLAMRMTNDSISFSVEYISPSCFEHDPAVHDVFVRFDVAGENCPVYLTFALDQTQIQSMTPTTLN